MGAVLRIGLTGGIGSGKSTVAQLLAGLGAGVIDADAIARSVTAPGGAAMAGIREAFGAEFVTADGALDRDRMRTLVFGAPDAKRRLEAIVHPLVAQLTHEREHRLLASGHTGLVFDVPLLVESRHWRARVDRVLVIDCTQATQIRRVIARSGLARQAIEAIIAAQAPRALRLQAADAVIFNEDIDLQALSSEVQTLAASFGLSSDQTSALVDSA